MLKELSLEVCNMKYSKKVMTKALTVALAAAMITGSGVSAIAASAATPQAPQTQQASAADYIQALKNSLVVFVTKTFSRETARNLVSKIYCSAFEKLSEEGAQKLEAVLELIDSEDFPVGLKQMIGAEIITAVLSKIPEDKLIQIIQTVQQIKENFAGYSFENGVLYYTENDLKYRLSVSLNGFTATVVEYTGDAKKVTIPAKVKNCKVTSLALSSETALTAITVPATLRTINAESVAGVPTLKYIYVKADNPVLKSVKGVVYSKAGDKLVAVAPSRTAAIEPGVVVIGEKAFSGNKAKKITLPASVKKIEKSAFKNTASLNTISFGESVESIAADAFDGVNENVLFDCTSGDSVAARYAQQHGFRVLAPMMTVFKSDETVLLGGSARMVAQASFGTGSYTFAFFYKKPGEKTWKKIQDYSEKNYATFTPAYTGTYELRLCAKDSDGTINEEVHDLKVIQTINNTSTVSDYTVKAKKKLTVNCSARLLGTKYSVFYQQKGTSTWKNVAKNSTAPTVALKFDKAGEYTVCVKAIGPFGFISKKYFDITVE